MIYFIQHGEGGPIKIGTATNVRARMESIQTSSPVKLKLLLVIEGGVREERALHDLFQPHRIQGEWFHPPAVIEYIGRLDPVAHIKVKEPVRRTRRRNTGSIHQRTFDGLWAGSISLGYDESGKRVRKTVYGRRRSEVESKLRSLLRQRTRSSAKQPA